MAAVSTIIFSFTGTPYFFTIFAEMRVKKDYFKSMYLLTSRTTALIIGAATMVSQLFTTWSAIAAPSVLGKAAIASIVWKKDAISDGL